MNAVTLNGQITIPQEVRDELDLQPGQRAEFVRNQHGEFVLRKVVKPATSNPFEKLVGILGPGMTSDELMALTRGED